MIFFYLGRIFELLGILGLVLVVGGFSLVLIDYSGFRGLWLVFLLLLLGFRVL